MNEDKQPETEIEAEERICIYKEFTISRGTRNGALFFAAVFALNWFYYHNNVTDRLRMQTVYFFDFPLILAVLFSFIAAGTKNDGARKVRNFFIIITSASAAFIIPAKIYDTCLLLWQAMNK